MDCVPLSKRIPIIQFETIVPKQPNLALRIADFTKRMCLHTVFSVRHFLFWQSRAVVHGRWYSGMSGCVRYGGCLFPCR